VKNNIKKYFNKKTFNYNFYNIFMEEFYGIR
jgi:hypothetical protein